MGGRPVLAAVLLFAIAAEAQVPGGRVRSTELPRPRDPDAAVRAELEAARRAGTAEAYDLFLARHPDHKLAEVARRERPGRR
jgi:hypothetical protein